MGLQAVKTKQGGTSLIEILVTIIVVAIGLLGHASLIAVSARDNHTAYMRSQATLLTYDIIERLRMNPTLAKAGDFDIDMDADVDDEDTIPLQELRDWFGNVAQSLPSGDADISVDGNGNVTIVIQWAEVIKSQDGGDGSETIMKFITETVI